MKKRKGSAVATKLIISLVVLIGLGALLYPWVSNEINKRYQSRVIDDYVANVEAAPNEAVSRQLESAAQFNRVLWEENGSTLGLYNAELKGRYGQELDPDGNGVMGYISIPAIHANLPLRHGTQDEVLTNAIGHMEGTSLPVGGENTHAVLSGHRGLASSTLFTDLDQMAVGDVFYIHVLQETLAYQVDQVVTVLPEETRELAITPGEDYVTLLTCTPYGINSHRLLVRGARIPYTPEQEAAIQQSGGRSFVELATWALVAGFIVLAALLVLLIPFYYRRKARNGRSSQP